MEKLSFAVVGCGRISYKHIEALVKNELQAVLTAVCDELVDRAENKAGEYVTALRQEEKQPALPAVYTDYRQLLAECPVDVVVIATESGKHAEQALAALEAGKHVIVEKPMALSVSDADRMIATAAAKGVKLCVSHQNRFNLPVQKLRQAVEAGRFGRIIAGNARILWNRNQGYYEQAPWRGTYDQDGGCLMNQCIHNIDLLQWMLGGDMQEIQAMLGNYIHPYIEAEDYGSIQIRFQNGAIGNVEGTVCVYPRNLEETLTVLGEKGTVVIGGAALNEVKVWQFADGLDDLAQVQAACNKQIESVYGWGHAPLYADMIDSIHTGREPLVNGAEGKKGMAIILHAYRAAQQGRAVTYGSQREQLVCAAMKGSLPKL